MPSPDGKYIAFVRTGRNPSRGTGGFGRSNLRSDVSVMSSTGDVAVQRPLADAFLTGWTTKGQNLVCYRDGKFLLVSIDGRVQKQAAETGMDAPYARSERAAYMASLESFVWTEAVRGDSDERTSTIFTTRGAVASQVGTMGSMVTPSPDERYIAIAGDQMHLRVYDTLNQSWADLGELTIHPDTEWDYVKPSWNPWFADSSRLAFVSGGAVIVASPDGREKTVVARVANAGLATPSPDGRNVAFVVSTPRPRKARPDLKWWAGDIWIAAVNGRPKPHRVSRDNDDAIYDLNWFGNDRVVFDRIADEIFYAHCRLWSVTIPDQ